MPWYDRAVQKTVVINAVGLTRALLKRMPVLSRLGPAARIGHVTPAVTCSVQATYLTGTLPREHGIVGNGWYFRDECEVRFWHQSDKLVQRPRIWEIAKQRDPSVTCANLFWWNAMYSSADITVTPRPMYPADGRKIPDVWTNPPHLRRSLQDQLGPFPLFKFWGPATSIESTRWIARSAIAVDREFNPTLSLIYLPHLDYNLQRLGPTDSRIQTDLDELDGVIGELLDHFRPASGTRVIVLSEYGIEPVDTPVHLNRHLREAGLLSIREELGRELIDFGSSTAFAVADHQVAHVYVNRASETDGVRQVLSGIQGIAEILDRSAQYQAGIDHPRSGEFVVVAKPGAWFTYYYWQNDEKSPDFARTVDIHRKPGYDPAELFLDPGISLPQLTVGWTLLKRRMGYRSMLNVIPLNASLVSGSHGRPLTDPDQMPVFLDSANPPDAALVLPATSIRDLILGPG